MSVERLACFFCKMLSSLTKQKVNSLSHMEAELIDAGYKISKIMWSKRSTEAQGFKVNLNFFPRQREIDQMDRK